MNGLPVTLIEAQVAGLPIYASSNITREVDISNNIRFISLKESPRIWANEILNSDNNRNIIDFNTIKKMGYDDKNETLKIQNMYLKLIEEIV